MEIKIDPITGEEFYPIRRNQKFATPENRILFNNELAWQYRNRYTEINSGLKANHKILLSELEPGETKSFSKEYIKGLGYDFNLFTCIEVANEMPCFALYEFIFINLNETDLITINRKNDTN